MKLTVGEAAALLGVSSETVNSWIEDQALPAQQIRGQYRINRTEILEWATRRRLPIAPAAFDVERRVPSLSEALRAGGIHDAVPGEDVASSLGHIVAMLPLSDERDRETLTDILQARGTVGVTPVGGGVAIPHVRAPIVLSSAGAVVSLSYVKKPIDLHAPDGIEVDTLFLLVSPTVHVHLAMLAKLAHVLRDTSFRGAVRGRVASEIFDAIRVLEAS